MRCRQEGNRSPLGRISKRLEIQCVQKRVFRCNDQRFVHTDIQRFYHIEIEQLFITLKRLIEIFRCAITGLSSPEALTMQYQAHSKFIRVISTFLLLLFACSTFSNTGGGTSDPEYRYDDLPEENRTDATISEYQAISQWDQLEI